MSERAEPQLRIVRGAPDSTELAAVLLVLLSTARDRDRAGELPAPRPRAAAWGPARGWRPPGSWTAP
ncbi:acyl-CoA carboxylase epsilon subunit [Streptomyces sp. NPDC048349]|uniref:acyl-CoA carboxylase epsilon subunit n=1 Tax=Streptomyces sp. NPDC048349 TaxID=3155486 RepID=UPI0034252808